MRQQAVVVSVLPDTPAQRAGLQSGDQLLAVDGVNLEKLSWAEINTRLQGKRATFYCCAGSHLPLLDSVWCARLACSAQISP